ncbi:hypothetical protein H8E07_00920, partial [bacterium]|nr:hypothetical protein [bacterium]
MRARLAITLLLLTALASAEAGVHQRHCVGLAGMDRVPLDPDRAQGVMPNFDRILDACDSRLLRTG